MNSRVTEDASRQVISADVVKNANDAVYKSFTALLRDEEIRQLVNDVELWNNDTDSGVPTSKEMVSHGPQAQQDPAGPGRAPPCGLDVARDRG